MSNSPNTFNAFNPTSAERRQSARHSFTAAANVTDLGTRLQMSARTSDLDQRGCYIDTMNPFVAGTSVVLHIAKDQQSFNAMATVVYAHPAMGMGVVFDELSLEQSRILDRWLGKGAAPRPVPIAVPKRTAVPVVVPVLEQPLVAEQSTPSLEQTIAAVAPPGDQNHAEVLKYLVLMLIQKGVLVELEGRTLLERLLN